MADVNGVTFSTTGFAPNISHTITYTTSVSGSNTTYNFTIKSKLPSSQSYLGVGYYIRGYCKVNGVFEQFDIKTSDASWSGTTTHTSTCSVTVPSTSGTLPFVFTTTGNADCSNYTNSSYTVAGTVTVTVGTPYGLKIDGQSSGEIGEGKTFKNLRLTWSMDGDYEDFTVSLHKSNGVQIASESSWESQAITFNDFDDYPDAGETFYFVVTAYNYSSSTGWIGSDNVQSSNFTRFEPIPTSGTAASNLQILKSSGSVGNGTIVNYGETIGDSSLNYFISWEAGEEGDNNDLYEYVELYVATSENGNYTLAGEADSDGYDYLKINPYDITNRSFYKSSGGKVSYSDIKGKYIKFRIKGEQDEGNDLFSSYSGSVYVNYQVESPTIIYPVGLNKNTYNSNPYIKAKGGSDAAYDSTTQTYKIKNNTTGTSSNAIPYMGTAIFRGGSNNSLVTSDGLKDSNATTVGINIVAAPWVTGTRVAAGDGCTAVHMNQLRTACSTLASYYGVSVPSWTDSTIIAGETYVKAIHFIEIQNFLKQIAALVDVTLNFSEIKRGKAIKASHVNELREAIENL